MFSFFSKSSPPAPAVVPTDTIIPLSRHDDNYVNRSIVVLFMMRFDDVLDPEKLHSSLERLIERDGWRKLGARLRLNDQKKLEHHIPAEYGPKRPAVAYSHVRYEVDIEEHPLASKMPKATSKPAVAGDSRDFQEFMRPPDGPKSLDDYVSRDIPQLGLHVVSFNNATLVTLSWMHTLFDAMGRRELLAAWAAMLDGREEDIKPAHAFDVDPLEDLGTEATEEYVLANKVLSSWGTVVFVLRQMWEAFFYPQDETRLVCMPAAHMQKLKLTVNEELAARSTGKEKAFASEGDVLFAYISRLFLQHLRGNPKQSIVLMSAFGLRSVLGNDRLPANKAYIGNAVGPVMAILPAKDILTNPLSYTAFAVRRSIIEQGTRAQVEARVALQKAKNNPIFGDAGMQIFTMSNWAKAQFFDTDFSAAVITGGAASKARPDKLGKPSCILGDTFSRGFSLRNVAHVAGKDADGNVWWGALLRKGVWEKVAETLEKDF